MSLIINQIEKTKTHHKTRSWTYTFYKKLNKGLYKLLIVENRTGYPMASKIKSECSLYGYDLAIAQSDNLLLTFRQNLKK